MCEAVTCLLTVLTQRPLIVSGGLVLNISPAKSLDLVSPQTHTRLIRPVLICCAGADSVWVHAGTEQPDR